MPNAIGRSKTRSARNVIYEQIRASMAALGYDPLRPMFTDRWMRYRLIVVAVNHLATILHREPYRVYQALLCRAERTVRGRPFMPYKQTPGDPEGLREEERRGGLHVYCPCCGQDLLEAGKVTRKEVLNEISHRTSPHNSQQSCGETRDAIVCAPSGEGRPGATGHGGARPRAGGAEALREPHAPL